MELLDAVLERSILHWILNSSPDHRNEVVIRALASVDFCWSQRTTRRRFKKRIWQRLKDIYDKTKKSYAIIRSNQNYLLENIQPNDELFASLLSLDCLTKGQRHLIDRKTSKKRQCRFTERNKNSDILHFMRTWDEAKFSTLFTCLRQTNQKAVVRIMENGGVVIKLEVQNRSAKSTPLEETELPVLHKKIVDLRSKTKPWSRLTDKIISQLKDEGIEIVNSQLARTNLFVWIWCRSQAAIEYIQRLYESNQLRDVLFGLANIQPPESYIYAISTDDNQFKKIVVECPISVSLTETIHLGNNEQVRGVTKLRNEIYILCSSYSDIPSLICVFEDQSPFCFKRIIELDEIRYAVGIVSSERENCLFVFALEDTRVFKIATDTDGQQQIIRWIQGAENISTMSASRDGHLLLFSYSPYCLLNYGSDLKLIGKIPLPMDNNNLRHAVETTVGNFIILHESSGKRPMEEDIGGKEEKAGEGESSGRKKENSWCISELTMDGLIVRRYIPSNKTHVMIDPFYLSLDSDGQVFVVDKESGVILLDSDLKWNQIICQTRKAKMEDTEIMRPQTLCYDEEKKQLLVRGHSETEVYVHTLRRM